MEVSEELRQLILSLRGMGNANVRINSVEEYPDRVELLASVFTLPAESGGTPRRREYCLVYLPHLSLLCVTMGFIIEIPSEELAEVETFLHARRRHEKCGYHLKAMDEYIAFTTYWQVELPKVINSAQIQGEIITACEILKNEWEAAFHYLASEWGLSGAGTSETRH